MLSDIEAKRRTAAAAMMRAGVRRRFVPTMLVSAFVLVGVGSADAAIQRRIPNQGRVLTTSRPATTGSTSSGPTTPAEVPSVNEVPTALQHSLSLALKRARHELKKIERSAEETNALASQAIATANALIPTLHVPTVDIALPTDQSPLPTPLPAPTPVSSAPATHATSGASG